MDGQEIRLQERAASELRSLMERGTATGLIEAELLDRFVRARDETAFALLVERHGPMVLGICRRFLSDPHDAEDAFQATFLVLVRRAGSLRRKELLGNWLYGVACKVSRRARLHGNRRRSLLATSDQIDGRPRGGAGHPFEDGSSLLEEVYRLPPKYRSPILLCYFEGLTHDQAATRLGWPIGTVKGRLSRARDLLRPRLARRGIAPSSAAIASALACLEARAAVPAGLACSTVKAALALSDAARGCLHTMSAISLPVRSLVEGVSLSMWLNQTRSMLIPAFVTAAIVTGGVALSTRLSGAQFFGGEPAKRAARPGQNADAPSPAQPKAPEPKIKTKESKAGGDADASAAIAPGNMMMGSAGGMMRGMMDQGGFGGNGGAPELDDSRITIARLASKIATTDKNPRNQSVLKMLDEPVTLQFPSETPLEEVLKRIKDSSKSAEGKPLPIYVDPVGLSEAEKTLTSPVVIDLQDIPLRFSLRLVLKQLGMAYCVRDGVVIISSVQGIHQELMEAMAEQQMLYPKEYPAGSGGYGDMMMRGMMGGMGGGQQGGFR